MSRDQAVAARYAKHFGVTAGELKEYFQRNLRVITLKKPIKTTTYFVSRGGRVLSKSRLLPAGAQVFATNEGLAILEARCGNPLTKRLPKPREEALAPVAKETVMPPPETKVLASVESLAEPLPLAAEALVQPVVAAAPAIASSYSVAPMLEALGALFPALLGAAYVVHSSKAPPTVPELPGQFALALGFLGLYARCYLKARSARPQARST